MARANHLFNGRSFDDRRQERYDMWIESATLREPGCVAAKVRLHDLSASGFRADWPYRLAPGQRVWLKLPGFAAMPALVAWNRDFVIGAKFEQMLHPAVVDKIARGKAELAAGGS